MKNYRKSILPYMMGAIASLSTENDVYYSDLPSINRGRSKAQLTKRQVKARSKAKRAKKSKEKKPMKPRYLRIYDNGGETYDRYTILFTKKRIDGEFMCLSSSHDLVVGAHFSSPDILDYPVSSYLGNKIKFEHLPEKVRNLVLEDYKDIWNITEKEPKLNLFK